MSEIDPQALATYKSNWVAGLPETDRPVLNDDITKATVGDGPLIDVPEQIDVLAAGFPCQPFSKSGFQHGMNEARGTLFWDICRILAERRPSVILLENVRNLTGPRHQHEWKVIIDSLRDLGYRVSRTPSVFSPHFLPPSRGGSPQVRDRVFILGTYVGRERAKAEESVPPTLVRRPVDGWDPQSWDITWVLDDEDQIANLERYELTQNERAWIDVWDRLVRAHRAATGERLPGFPLWADAFEPVEEMEGRYGADLFELPSWKIDFLYKNARFYEEHAEIIDAWRCSNPELADFPPSRRKLEWQAQDIDSLWDTIMHFRPSGIRAKAPTYVPALVAITQTSIIGSRERRITPHEAARLQGLPKSFHFGTQRDAASYKQMGNGVHVGAAWHALRSHIEQDHAGNKDVPDRIRSAILAADANPTPDALSVEAFLFEKSRSEASPEPM